MKAFLAWAKAHAKMIAGAVGAAAMTISGFVAPNSGAGHIVLVLLAVLTTLGVYAVPNTPAPPAPSGGAK